HEAAGQVIEELYHDRLEEQVELLAHHFSRAENWTMAVQYGREAAEKASKLSRFWEALSTLEQAELWLLNLPDGQERKEILINIMLQQERQCETLRLHERQQALIDRMLSLLDPATDHAMLGEVYIRQGELYTILRRSDEAETFLNKSLAIWRSLSDAKGERSALRSMGLLHWRQGRYEDAVACNERAIAIDQSLNDSVGYADDRLNLGQVLRSMGDPEGALRCMEESLRINEVLHRNFFHGIWVIANVYRSIGESKKAMEYFRQVYELNKQYRVPYKEPFVLDTIANICWEQGETDECLGLCDELVSLTRNLNIRPELAQALNVLGLRLLALERHKEALPHLVEAADVFSQLGKSEDEIKALTGVACAYERSSESCAESLAAWEKVRGLQKSLSNCPGEIDSLEAMARLARHQSGDVELALQHYQDALRLAVEMGDAAKQG
ncbi:MAG: tetratricopeptide repeat protein, partial [Acidobacteria bacterium]|nr:tetratricopeptide repeat protein [Acidobacteriota bacterium]